MAQPRFETRTRNTETAEPLGSEVGILFPAVVDGQQTRAGEDKEHEHEAEQNGGIAIVVGREEALWGVRHEIGDRHVAAQDEGDWTGKQAEEKQQAAKGLQNALGQGQG